MKTSTMRRLFKAATISAALLAAVGIASTAGAQPTVSPSSTATWNGKGTTFTDGTRTLNTERCDAENPTQYLLWVLAGSKATTASISVDGDVEPMVKTNVDKKGFSTFKYVMPGPIDLDALEVVFATYSDGKNKATLTISHGCLDGSTPVCYRPSGEAPDMLVTTPPTAGSVGEATFHQSTDGSCSGQALSFTQHLVVRPGTTSCPAPEVDWVAASVFYSTIDQSWWLCGP